MQADYEVFVGAPARTVVVFAQMHQKENRGSMWTAIKARKQLSSKAYFRCCIVNIVPCIHIQLLTFYMYMYIFTDLVAVPISLHSPHEGS